MPSQYGRQRTKPIKKIVWHCMSEIIDADGAYYYSVNYLSILGLSAHAMITPSGVVIRCRKDSQTAYHAKGHNDMSLGVEVLIPGCHNYGEFLKAIKKPYMTHVQKVALYELFQSWCRKYNLSRADICRHSDLSPNKFDPGSGADWSQLEDAYRLENEKEEL